MIAIWMLTAVVVATLLGMAAWATEGVLRMARLPTRWVWLAALAGTLGLVGTLSQRSESEAPARVASRTAIELSELPASGVAETSPALLDRLTMRVRDGMTVATARVEALTSRPGFAEWDASLIAGWGFSSGVLLLLLGWTLRRSRRLRQDWEPAELQGALVRIAPASGPAVMGVFRPEVVVPRWLIDAPEEEQRLAIQHELEHVRGRDPLLLAAGSLVTCLLPWNPAAWWMLARLRLAAEIDCDARVIARGAARMAYGSLLLDIAGRSTVAVRGSTALAGRPSHLERRLDAMTENRRKPSLLRGAALAGISLALGLAACEATLPTSGQIEGLDVESAEVLADRAQLLDGDAAPLTVVDGEIVTADVARAIGPEEIESIEVIRGAAAAAMFGAEAEAGVIRLRTRAASAEAEATASAVAGSVAATRARTETTAAAAGLIAATTARTEAATNSTAATTERIEATRLRARASADGLAPATASYARVPGATSAVLLYGRVSTAAEPSTASRVAGGAADTIPAGAVVEGRPGTLTITRQQDGVVSVQVPADSAAAAAVTIRRVGGAAVMTRGSSPLIYVDGVLIPDAEVSDMVSDEIESIEVIKGPAAASIYGDDAESGVIRITTKAAAGANPDN